MQANGWRKRKKDADVPVLKIRRFKDFATVPELPERKTSGSAGLDLSSIYHVAMFPGDIRCIHTGISAKIPDGCWGMIVVRSSVGKCGVSLASGAAVIDSDYTGEILIYLRNNGSYFYEIGAGQRVAQMIILPYIPCQIVEVDKLEETERGSDGFGSTGK